MIMACITYYFSNMQILWYSIYLMHMKKFDKKFHLLKIFLTFTSAWMGHLAMHGEAPSVWDHLLSLKSSSNSEFSSSDINSNASKDPSDTHENEHKMASTVKHNETVPLSMIAECHKHQRKKRRITATMTSNMKTRYPKNTSPISFFYDKQVW